MRQNPQQGLLEIATALVGRHESVVEVASRTLSRAYPALRCALLQRGEGNVRVTRHAGIGDEQVAGLARVCGLEVTFEEAIVAEALPASRFCAVMGREGESELVLGVWALDAASMPTQTEIDLLAQLIADAVRGEREVEALRRASQTDALTGLLSRRAVLEVLRREELRARRYQRDLAVLYLDLDGFKRLNDAHGHAAGDRALVHLGELLQGTVRSVDAVGRLGGDEFLVVLPDTSPEAAERLARRIRQRVSKSPLELDGRQVALGTSVGVACVRDAGNGELVTQADLEMLADKKRRGGLRAA